MYLAEAKVVSERFKRALFTSRRKNMKIRLFFIMTLSLTMVGLTLPVASAQVATARQNETRLIRIETKVDVLKEEAQRFADRNTNTGAPDQFVEHLTGLEQSLTRLRETLDNGDPITRDLRDALSSATLIDSSDTVA
jgi:hypothetical protein